MWDPLDLLPLERTAQFEVDQPARTRNILGVHLELLSLIRAFLLNSVVANTQGVQEGEQAAFLCALA